MRQLTVYIQPVSRDEPRYNLDELAELGGVSRRTVRSYIQERLVPSPFGVGRGPHYGPAHLQALVRVKSLQEAGRTLDEIRHPAPAPPRAGRVGAHRPAVATWRRISLAPGVELHVSGDARLPSAAGLESLTEWCRAHLIRPGHPVDGDTSV